MKVWQQIASCLEQLDYLAVGGLPLDDPGLLDVNTSRLASIRYADERSAAAGMAGLAHWAQQPTCLAVESGPSAANTIAAVTEAKALCSPLLVLSSSLRSELRGRGAFQEMPLLELFAPLVKWNFSTDRVDDLSWALRHATLVMRSDRPGPVHLNVVGLDGAEEFRPIDGAITAPGVQCAPQALETLCIQLSSSDRVVILAGGGARAAGTEIERLATLLDAPVLTTVSGRGTISGRHPLAGGLVGLFVNPATAIELSAADTVLVLGSQLEETALHGDWLVDKQVIHVDASAHSLARLSCPATLVQGDVRLVVEQVLERMAPASGNSPARMEGRDAGRLEAAERYAQSQLEWSPTARLLRRVFDELPDDAVVALENGLHDMWAYLWPLCKIAQRGVVAAAEQTLLSFSLAAGHAISEVSDRPVMAVVGDATLRFAGSLLDDILHSEGAMCLLVLDDGGMGWPREMRKLSGLETHICDYGDLRSLGAQVESAGAHYAMVNPVDHHQVDVALQQVDWATTTVLHVRTDPIDFWEQVTEE